jgi:hypothetical protein
MSTTKEAINRFNPRDRGCYVEGELPLKYLPSKFYRYEERERERETGICQQNENITKKS